MTTESTPLAEPQAEIHGRQPADASERYALFTRVYNELDAASVANGQLAQLYHPDVTFRDPFHEVRGLGELQRYFAALYRSIESIDFDYGHFWAADHSDYLRWTMTFRHPAIAGGKPVEVEGGTEFHWQDGKVIHHRDFFDGADMLYNHIPVIGWALRKVRERMA